MAAAATHRGFAESDLSVWDKARYHLFLLYALHSGNAPAAFIIMSSQKSHKHYIGMPVGMQFSEAPLPKTLDQCLWFSTGECQRSGLRTYVTKEPYDGKACKCFAFIPKEYVK